MLESIFLVLLGLAVLFFLLMMVWRSVSLGGLDVVLWFILAAAVHDIGVPYSHVTSGDTVVSGVQSVQSMSGLSVLFIGIGVVVLLFWLVGLVLPMLQMKFDVMM